MNDWKNGRPDGWDAQKLIPEFYDIRVLHDGEWVDEKLHSEITDQWAFEAGADAYAKAIYEWLEETKIAIDTSHNHRVESVVFDYQWRKLFKGIE